MTTATKLLIGGHEATSPAEPLTVFYPWDQTTEVGTCYRLTEADFPGLFEKAEHGYQVFQKSKPMERASILTSLANRIHTERETIARLITLETAKPLRMSRIEVDRTVSVCKGYADLLNTYGERWLYVQNRRVQIKRFAYGPVLAITPFNFPLNLIIHKLAPAIAAGTSFTVKPASKTPITALHLGALAIECGYPHISVIPCDSSVAEKLVQAPVFKKVSFTGSSDVGRKIQILASGSHKSVSMELGSNSACIVDDFSYGLPAIARRCAETAFQFAGQSCISLQCVYIKQDLYDEFMTALFEATRKIKIGDPMKLGTDLSSLISLQEMQRVRHVLRDAIQQHANIAYGGSTFNAFTYNPTILNRVNHKMSVICEEVFAPLLSVYTYESFEEALHLINQSRYGIHTGVYTEDINKVTQAFETLEVGGVLHNDSPTTRLDYLPYGGVKESGYSREGVLSGIEEMTYSKNLILHQ
jgi:acyl-CoA reductase-like NAD-dependent aldehyde dehydrogenase